MDQERTHMDTVRTSELQVLPLSSLEATFIFLTSAMNTHMTDGLRSHTDIASVAS